MIDESEANDTFKRVQGVKLDAMLSLCETLNCRRVHILDYFGQASEPCGNCDTCLSPPTSFDGSVAAQKILSTIYRVDQRFAAGHVIDILRGIDTERVTQWRHDQLSTYGIGSDKSEAEWRALLRQLIALGLVAVDYENFSSLKLTEASRAVLRGETKVQLRQYKKAEKAVKHKRQSAKDYAEAELSMAEQTLFDKLRWWRVETARTHNVPAYVIFPDATLREIARQAPQTLIALRAISGVGDKKLESYGAEILQLIEE